MEEIDLFENYKILPIEVQKILSEYDDRRDLYQLWKLVNDLEKVGYLRLLPRCNTATLKKIITKWKIRKE
jgi:hypothetical protein